MLFDHAFTNITALITLIICVVVTYTYLKRQALRAVEKFHAFDEQYDTMLCVIDKPHVAWLADKAYDALSIICDLDASDADIDSAIEHRFGTEYMSHLFRLMESTTKYIRLGWETNFIRLNLNRGKFMLENVDDACRRFQERMISGINWVQAGDVYMLSHVTGMGTGGCVERIRNTLFKIPRVSLNNEMGVHESNIILVKYIRHMSCNAHLYQLSVDSNDKKVYKLEDFKELDCFVYREL